MKLCFWAVVAICTSTIATAETSALQLINALRETAGRDALMMSSELEAAALAHANDMGQNDFFSHTGSDGSDVGQRVTRTGYRWCVVAENIAKGQESLAEVFEAWKNSPGHRQNMERPEVKDFAVVGTTGSVWVMVLAAQDC